MEFDVKKGTTTVALVCKDGVVLAADKRASYGLTVAHKNAKKIHKLTKNIGATGAGVVGDIQNLVSLLEAEASLYEMKSGKKISTSAMASLASRILHGSRFYPYLALFIVAGFDKTPSAYSIDPVGGVSKDDYLATGSGSQVAYGVLEDRFKKEMSLEEGIKLAVKAINAAIQRDLPTGDGISVVVVTKKGYRELKDEEIKEVV